MMRTKRFNVNWPALISLFVGISIIVGVILVLSGCVQRECDYDPNTGLVHYKSVSFATDASADVIHIETPSGVLIEINWFRQYNDSLKIKYNPYTGIALETSK